MLDNRKMDLTRPQTKAATILWGNNAVQTLQLVAGAGSGKTATLVEAAANCANDFAPAGDICLITFTRKAASEMKERLHHRGIKPGFVGTMHSLGYRLLSDRMQLQMLENADEVRFQLARQLFPNRSGVPAELLLMPGFLAHDERVSLNEHYERYKRERAVFDYDDLISKGTLTLREESNPPYPVLMVDEFQDTSPRQLEFVQALAATKNFLVGDDWQSIYKFRGADVAISREVNQHFRKAKRLFLKRNFRSRKGIVKLGNKCIRQSTDFISKRLRAHRGGRKRATCHIVSAETDASDALSRFATWREKRNLGPTTVLVRTNHLKMKVEKVMPAGWQVMTIHAAKGLEFDSVLVHGIVDHIIPHRWGDADEEIRLLYVALSRARDDLHFTAWNEGHRESRFLPFLAKNCKLNYL